MQEYIYSRLEKQQVEDKQEAPAYSYYEQTTDFPELPKSDTVAARNVSRVTSNIRPLSFNLTTSLLTTEKKNALCVHILVHTHFEWNQALIGRGGRNIRDMQKNTQCKIHVAKDRVEIEGLPNNRERCVAICSEQLTGIVRRLMRESKDT